MTEKTEVKFVAPEQVESMRARLISMGIKLPLLADMLGLSRSNTTAIVNGKRPMRVVYRYAILAAILEIARKRKAEAQGVIGDPRVVTQGQGAVHSSEPA